MFKVGNENDHGTVELQDLLFTTKGATAGAILVEWNVNAVERGLAGLWDCHVRIGGATGTDLNSADCPALVDTPSPNCQTASMMMHITPEASGYFENMWLWVADHMIDDPDLKDPNNTMVSSCPYFPMPDNSKDMKKLMKPLHRPKSPSTLLVACWSRAEKLCDSTGLRRSMPPCISTTSTGRPRCLLAWCKPSRPNQKPRLR
jgi:hypothetical protein